MLMVYHSRKLSKEKLLKIYNFGINLYFMIKNLYLFYSIKNAFLWKILKEKKLQITIFHYNVIIFFYS